MGRFPFAGRSLLRLVVLVVATLAILGVCPTQVSASTAPDKDKALSAEQELARIRDPSPPKIPLRSPKTLLKEAAAKRAEGALDVIARTSKINDAAGRKYRLRDDFLSSEYYASEVTKTWASKRSPRWDGHNYALFEHSVPQRPLLARYTPEQDCRVCMSWIHATVAWLPEDDEGFGPEEVQGALAHACNDTWVIHDVDLRLDKVAIDDVPDTPAEHWWNNKQRCEQMHREDSGMVAFQTIWGMWNHLQPIGGLPQAACCRLEYCPCIEFEDDKKTKFYSGVPALTPPMFIT